MYQNVKYVKYKICYKLQNVIKALCVISSFLGQLKTLNFTHKTEKQNSLVWNSSDT